MKNLFNRAVSFVKNAAKTVARGIESASKTVKTLVVGAGAALVAGTASAQSNITGVLDSLDGYVTAGIAIGVSILLFTLGRAIVRKVAR